MARVAVESEYEDWGNGVCHGPSDIKMEFAYQNERVDWTFTKWLSGNPGPYDERQVIQFGQEILMKRKQKTPL